MSIKIKYSDDVLKAKELSRPVLALESTIIAHGMPYPENLDFAKKAESLCKEVGVSPATIAVIDGEIHVGLSTEKMTTIAQASNIKKISMKDISVALSEKSSGATTVSSTAYIAKTSGIDVFATGGIGGVHRKTDITFDVSQDLIALSNTPIVVVSSGAKSILDLPKTVEVLESLGVTTLGYKTSTFPSFYSRFSTANKIKKIETIDEIVDIFNFSRALKLKSAVLVANPVPKKNEIRHSKMEKIINKAIEDLDKTNISGKKVTPFLLKAVYKHTKGKSLKANISLALNNVKIAAKIANCLHNKK